MDFSFRFDLWFARLPRSPQSLGRVELCVVRPAEGRRATPATVQVDPRDGIVGDRWRNDPARTSGTQVSLINVHVLRSLCDGDDARMSLAGDNLVVDLDLSEANLPTGTLLTIGTAVLEISDEPHRPCKSFVERYGAEAAKKVARATRRGRRGRGVMTRVMVAGAISVGDAIHVKRPSTACMS